MTAADAGVLLQVEIGPKDQLAAVLLEDGKDRAFALWRQEELRSGWSWTIDVVVVPIESGAAVLRAGAAGDRAAQCRSASHAATQ